MKWVSQLCLTLCNTMNCSLPGSSVHGIPQARILKCSSSLLLGIFPTQGLARDLTWRDERCRRWDSLSIFYGLPVYSKFKILFYTFTKASGQRFDIFSSPSPRFIISINHCCSSNRVPASVILWESAFLPKSCLPLTSWAHYLLKRLLAIVSLKIPNFYKL